MRDRGFESAKDDGLTRRGLLARGAQAGVGMVAAGGLLAACGGSSSTPSSSTASTVSQPWNTGGAVAELPGGTPVRGGTLKLGVITGGSSETLIPVMFIQLGDIARGYTLYNYLFYQNRDIVPLVPGLALSAEPNAAATKWILHLRPDVHWHDGSPFTADDVVWTLGTWSKPSNAFVYGVYAGIVDFTGVRKRDTLTVEVPLLSPLPALPSLFAYQNMAVIKNGMTNKDIARNPIGTGPFMYKSFTPGKYSVFTKNPHYWEEGKPYLDEYIVDSSYSDPTALFNAVLGGAVDAVSNIDFALARAQVASKQVQVLAGPPTQQSMMFVMRVDKAPFSDVRVRQAFRLLADRPALREGALSNFGMIGNDLPGVGAQYFDYSLVRHRDVEQARSLFKAAGMLGHTFTLQTSDVTPGFVQSATLLAQQATEAGVKVNLVTLAPSQYFLTNGTSTSWFTRTFGQDYLSPIASLASLWLESFVPGCSTNDTHWGNVASPAQVRLMKEAIAEANPSRAAPLWRECQEQQFNEGGFLMFATFPFLDAAATTVRGLKAGGFINYNNYRIQDGWLAS